MKLTKEKPLRRPHSAEMLTRQAEPKDEVSWPNFLTKLKEEIRSDEYEVGNELTGYLHMSALRLGTLYAILHPDSVNKIVEQINESLQIKEAQRSLENGDPYFPGMVVGLIPGAREKLTLDEKIWNKVKSVLYNEMPGAPHYRITTQWDRNVAVLGLLQLFPDKKDEIAAYKPVIVSEVETAFNRTKKTQRDIGIFLKIAAVACLLFPELKPEIKQKFSDLQAAGHTVDPKSISSSAYATIIQNEVKLRQDGTLDVPNVPQGFHSDALPERSLT